MTVSEFADEELAKVEKFPLVELHQEMAFKKTSEILLQLALLVRTYDEQLNSPEDSEKHLEFAKADGSGEDIGTLEAKTSST